MKPKVETKNIYQKIIEESSKQYIITRENLQIRQLPNIDFKNAWKKISIQNLSKTNYCIYKCNNNKSKLIPNCEHCGITVENLQLFIKHKRILKIWKHFQPYLNQLTGQTYIPQQHIQITRLRN